MTKLKHIQDNNKNQVAIYIKLTGTIFTFSGAVNFQDTSIICMFMDDFSTDTAAFCGQKIHTSSFFVNFLPF